MKINKGFTPTPKSLVSGFTLMELLVVIGIMAIIVSISFYFLQNFGKKDALEKDVAGLTSFIRGARLLSIASKDASTFGIHLESDKVVLFEGNTYTPGGANEKIMAFSDKVYMSAYSLSLESPDIIFARLSGNTSNFGTITFSLKDNSTSTTITVLRTGVIQ